MKHTSIQFSLMHKIYYLSTGNYSIFAQPSLINVLKQKFAYHVLCKIMANVYFRAACTIAVQQ